MHIAEPVGTASDERALDALLAEQIAPARRDRAGRVALARHAVQPAYGRVGLIDLPQLLLTSAVVPWFELLCLAALPFAPAVGRATCHSC